jgi:hypothetical protein
VASMFAANSMEIGLVVGMVVGGVVFSAKGIIHSPVCMHLFVAADNCPAAVHDCAADVGEGDGASCVAHCDNG